MGLLNEDNKDRIDPTLDNAAHFWLDFKKWKFDIAAKWINKGEIPSGRFLATGLTIPQGGDELFADMLRGACKEMNVPLVEFDCRDIKSYSDALWLFNTLANGKPKMVHISPCKNDVFTIYIPQKTKDKFAPMLDSEKKYLKVLR